MRAGNTRVHLNQTRCLNLCRFAQFAVNERASIPLDRVTFLASPGASVFIAGAPLRALKKIAMLKKVGGRATFLNASARQLTGSWTESQTNQCHS